MSQLTREQGRGNRNVSGSKSLVLKAFIVAGMAIGIMTTKGFKIVEG